MDLRPPLPADLTPRTIARFELLKPRLARGVGGAGRSVTRSPTPPWWCPRSPSTRPELRSSPGASFYEERLLFLLIRLRNPRARMVFVTSQPVHPIDARVLLPVPGRHPGEPRPRARSRCSAPTTPPRARSPRRSWSGRASSQRIRDGIDDTKRAYLTVFNSTPLERRLAVLLGIPLNGVRPEPHPSGNEVGQPQGLPRGRRGRCRWASEDLRTEHDVGERARRTCAPRGRGSRRAVRQAQRQLLGRGQRASSAIPDDGAGQRSREALRAARVRRCRPRRSTVYFEKFAAHGRHRRGVHRGARRRPRPARSCASARAARSLPISTHDQILGGPSGQVFLGCRFPARDELPACASRRQAIKIGSRSWPATAWSAASASTSWSGATRPARSGRSPALEINLRMGGTTHPYLALQFLTGGAARSGDRPLPLVHRPDAKVLPRHGQPALRAVPRACCPRT